jgi:predicted O-methyltransferase YrrM
LAYTRFCQNTKRWAPRIKVYKEESRRALAQCTDELFDIVYVDGDHEGRAACLDVLLSVPLLKMGGVMIIDDYEWDDDGGRAKIHPRTGIDNALMLNYDRMQVFYYGYQIAARRIA